jgi:hypothetical protein
MLVRKPEGRRSFRDQGRDGGDKRCTGFIQLRAGTNGTTAVRLIMSYQVPENVEFLEQLSTY